VVGGKTTSFRSHSEAGASSGLRAKSGAEGNLCLGLTPFDERRVNGRHLSLSLLTGPSLLHQRNSNSRCQQNPSDTANFRQPFRKCLHYHVRTQRMPGGYESQEFVRALARVADPVVGELPHPIIALTHQPPIPIHPLATWTAWRQIGCRLF